MATDPNAVTATDPNSDTNAIEQELEALEQQDEAGAGDEVADNDDDSLL
jgi:hypothetical protein